MGIFKTLNDGVILYASNMDKAFMQKFHQYKKLYRHSKVGFIKPLKQILLKSFKFNDDPN